MLTLNQFDYKIIDVKKINKKISKLLSTTGAGVIGGVYCEINRETEQILTKYTKFNNILTSSGTSALLISLEYAISKFKNKKIVIHISEYLYYSLINYLKHINQNINILKAHEDEVTLTIPSETNNDIFNIFLITSHNNKNSNINDIIFKYKKDNRFIIEDRCLVFGSPFQHNSDIQCYSFSNNKMIIAGEGGCVSSSNEEFLEWARWRTFSGISTKSKLPFFMYLGDYNEGNIEIPFKCSISGIVSSSIYYQCLVLEDILEKRRNNYQYMSDKLNFNNNTPYAPLFYTLKLNDDINDRKVKQIQIKLLNEGIQTHLGVLPYNFYSTGIHNKKQLSLPVHSLLSKKNLNHIIMGVKKIL